MPAPILAGFAVGAEAEFKARRPAGRQGTPKDKNTENKFSIKVLSALCRYNKREILLAQI